MVGNCTQTSATVKQGTKLPTFIARILQQVYRQPPPPQTKRAESGWVLQGFFLGNLLPMMAVVGVIYQESPLRVCNAYGHDDQQTTGFWMVLCACAVAGVWLWRVMAAQLASEA